MVRRNTDSSRIISGYIPPIPEVNFAYLFEMNLIPKDEARRFESGEITESDIARTLHHPRLSLGIDVPVERKKPANLEATTLFVFDGPSIDEVRAEDHVRTWLSLEPYKIHGKLSLTKPEKPYGRFEKPISDGILFVMDILHLPIHHLMSGLDAVRKEEGTSKLNWNLFYTKIGQYDKDGLYVGKGSFEAMKCLARSRQQRMVFEYMRKSRVDMDHILGTKLIGNPSRYPMIYTKTSYSIPPEGVDAMLDLGSPDETKGPPRLKLFTGIEAEPLRPNTKETDHVIYAFTKVKGIRRTYVSTLGFHGPEFYIKQLGVTEHFVRAR